MRLFGHTKARIRGYYYYLAEQMFPSKIKDAHQIPIIINNFNRLSMLQRLIKSLRTRGYNKIVILDNCSSYQPLLEWYKTCEIEIVHLPKNYGFRALWKHKPSRNRFCNDYYIYTDPDMELDENCPNDLIERMFDILKNKRQRAFKIGPSLRIDNLPLHYCHREQVISFESKYYTKTEKIDDLLLYRAPIDTTFALYRPRIGLSRSSSLESYRMASPYSILHLPWYQDSMNLDEEELYYKNACTKNNNTSMWTLLEVKHSQAIASATKKIIIAIALFCLTIHCKAQQVDYSVVSVPEESGIEFTKVTSDNDYVCQPVVRRNSRSLSWFTNRIIDISQDGTTIAYLSARNNSTNIFIKELSKQGSSIQRTTRQSILDFAYSPDGKFICFSEKRGNDIQVFQTDATQGYVCRQITSGAKDYSPRYSFDMNSIFFSREEKNGFSIWSYDLKNNFLSTFTSGMSPSLIEDESKYYCVRTGGNGKSEIWKVDYNNSIDECIVSDINRSFTTPSISPDGEWILMTGESIIQNANGIYRNTDIYVCRTDGTELTQLTFHAADDLSPVWGKDGKYIYFISQRGSANGTANIWKMTFNNHK